MDEGVKFPWQKVREMYLQGYTVEQVAFATNVSNKQCAGHLWREGLLRKVYEDIQFLGRGERNALQMQTHEDQAMLDYWRKRGR